MIQRRFTYEADSDACADRLHCTAFLLRVACARVNGWIDYVVKGQILRPGKAGKGPVFDVDQDTNPLEPILGFMDDQGVSVFWRKASGISGPAKITVRWSQLKPSGLLAFGKPSTAGGQPCD